MKNFRKNFYFIIAIAFLCTDKVAALSLEGNVIEIVGYAICILFVLVGIFIILQSKFGGSEKSYYKNENKNEVVGLIDKKTDDTIKDDFNPDSIYKTLPSFRQKNFLNETFEQLKEKLLDDKEITNIELVESKIIDFEHKDEKDTITTKFLINIEKLDEKKETIKNKCIYKTTSVNKKEEIVRQCPNCGGKIKDNKLNRCKFCGYKLKSISDTDTNVDEWKFEKYEKED